MLVRKSNTFVIVSTKLNKKPSQGLLRQLTIEVREGLKNVENSKGGGSEGHFPLQNFFGSKWPKNQF